VRASDLLGATVVDRRGADLGQVHDLILVQDGSPIGPVGAAFRLHSLLFGASAVGVRLGFARRDVRGPWPLRAAFSAVHDRMLVAPWDHIAAIQERRIRLGVPADEVPQDLHVEGVGARVLDAGLELLDRQMIDQPDGRMAGNVDDLELAFPAEGGPPFVSAILAGPGALARRIGGRLGDAIASVHERLQESGVEGPARISFGVVASIGSDVRLTVSRQELETHRFERWARDTIIAKIPGSERRSS
jgi:sporulation protein YlmC with PRC-barrel domain